MTENEELKQKKVVRGGHRAYATKILGQAKGLLQEYNVESEAKLLQHKVTLEKRVQILEQLDEEIFAVTKAEDINAAIEEAGIFTEGITDVLLRIDKVILDHKSKTKEESPTASAVSEGSKLIAKTNAKLPKLILRPFGGDPSEFHSFSDSFKSSVHENSSLSDVDKMNHLKSLCQGQAALCISGFSITAANYSAAVKCLTERFGDTRVIVNHHMDSLVNLQPVRNENDVKGVRFLFDKVQSHVRALEALDVPKETYSQLLVPMLTKKIPHSLMIDMSKQMKKKTWDLEALLNILQEELEARERLTPEAKFSSEPNSQLRRFPAQSKKNMSTASALFVSEKRKSLVSCTYCKQSHNSHNCQVFKTPQLRKDFLRRDGRCFVCLRKGHLGKACYSNSKCLDYSGRHHVSICDRQKEKRSSSLDASSKPFVPNQSQSETNISDETPVATHVGISTTDKTVLLQTAIASISRPDCPTETIKARMILDSGSQRSYVSDRLKNAINLPVIGTEQLEIKTFGNARTVSRKMENVQFMIQNPRNDFSIVLSALSVPLICAPLQRQSIQFAQSKHKHLLELTLADNCSGNEDSQIDILIGADNYYKIATGRLIRGEPHEPVALSTHLGYVLTGELSDAPKPTLSSADQVNLVSATHVLRTDAFSSDTAYLHGENIRLDEQVKQFYDLESFGINDKKDGVYEKFVKGMSRKEGRYEIGLPWKDNIPNLPSNYGLSFSRLNSLVNRLKRDPEILEQYDNVIRDQIENKVVEIVGRENDNVPENKCHYLTHHPVIRKEAVSSKLRIVYNGSLRVGNNPSLNNCLHSGPSLIPKIFDIMIRFRWFQIPLTADISKAFLQILIKPEDREYLRFL